MNFKFYGYNLKLFIERLGAILSNKRKRAETNHFLSYLTD